MKQKRYLGEMFLLKGEKHKIISVSKRKTTTSYRVTFLAFLLTNSYDTHNLLKHTLQYREVPANGTYGM